MPEFTCSHNVITCKCGWRGLIVGELTVENKPLSPSLCVVRIEALKMIADKHNLEFLDRPIDDCPRCKTKLSSVTKRVSIDMRDGEITRKEDWTH
jgi:hypothetical protein